MAKHKQPRSFLWTLIRFTGQVGIFVASIQAQLIMAEQRWTRRSHGLDK